LRILYIIDINYGAYYRLCDLWNDSLSLPVDCRPGILCALKMVHLYRNTLKIHL